MFEQIKRSHRFSFAAVVTGMAFVLAAAVFIASVFGASVFGGDSTKEDAKKDAATKQDASNASKDADGKDAAKTSPDKKDSSKKDADKKAAKEKEKKAAEEEIEPADNSYCVVCHLNYETEKLTRSHQIAAVGCDKCHGASEKHSGDEDGLTAPDVIFAHEDVDKFCMTCHPKEKIEKHENHKEAFDPKVPADEHLICTECHGENHKMAVRTRKWDKKTRKLLSDDGVRMMYKNSPATEGVPDGGKKADKAK